MPPIESAPPAPPLLLSIGLKHLVRDSGIDSVMMVPPEDGSVMLPGRARNARAGWA